MSVSSEREEKLLEDLLTRFQDGGIVVYGEIDGAPGTYAKIRVKSDGTLKVEGVTTISGTVNVSDRWERQLGQIDIQRYLGSTIGLLNPLHAQIVYGGAVIDPRSIRVLNPNNDAVTVWGDTAKLRNAESGDLAVELRMNSISYDPRQVRSLVSTDVVTAYGSLGALQQRAVSLDLYTALRYAGSEIDPRSVRALVKTTDELYSVLRTDAGVAYDARQVQGSQSQQLLQRATTYDLYVQLRSAGSEIDPRQVLGSQAQQLLQRALTYELLTTIRQGGSELSTSNPIFAGIVDASGNRLPSMDVASRRGYVTVTDGTNAMPTMDAAARKGYVSVTDLAATDIATVRWGIPREPTWTDGAEQTAPGAGTTLVTKTVTAAKTGRVFGVHISADEANQFQLLVDASVIKRFALGAAGVIHIVLSAPLKDSIAAASVITIKNVTAGTAGKVYQASLFYDEV